MNEFQNGQLKAASEVDRAKQEVAKAEAALSNRLHEATALGEATMKRAFRVAGPVLVGVVALGGIVWIASMLRRGRRSSPRLASSERSVMAEVVRAAALQLASIAARRVAERVLAAPDATQSIPAGRADSPQVPSHAR